MVFLKFIRSMIRMIVYLCGLAIFTQNSLANIADEIALINDEILDLEVSYELGEKAYDVNLEAQDIKNELLFHEYQIGTPKDENNNWNKSEQMILDAKIKLQALQEKIKLEGDWGQLRFRIIDFRGSDPGQLKLRYNYGF